MLKDFPLRLSVKSKTDAFQYSAVTSPLYREPVREEEKLPARIKCNGKTEFRTGVSACQARAGLIQDISFLVPVVVSPDPLCDVLETRDHINFAYTPPVGQCVFLFMEKGEKKRIHRHTAIGYQKILLRED